MIIYPWFSKEFEYSDIKRELINDILKLIQK